MFHVSNLWTPPTQHLHSKFVILTIQLCQEPAQLKWKNSDSITISPLYHRQTNFETRKLKDRTIHLESPLTAIHKIRATRGCLYHTYLWAYIRSCTCFDQKVYHRPSSTSHARLDSNHIISASMFQSSKCARRGDISATGELSEGGSPSIPSQTQSQYGVQC